jgi:competence protein ComEA
VDRGHLAAAVVVLLLAAGAGVWYGRDAPDPPVVAFATAGPPSVGLTIHVAGAVVAPGLVEVAEGSRVADAVAAAGGALPGARLSGLNLAAPLHDGQQLTVPTGLVAGGAGSPGADDGRVPINTAEVGDLERLPGVGPVLAERIRQHRESYGPFATVEDLLDVPGIGEGKLAALRDAVQVP